MGTAFHISHLYDYHVIISQSVKSVYLDYGTITEQLERYDRSTCYLV